MIERVRWARLARAHRQLGGQIFNPSPAPVSSSTILGGYGGADPLFVTGSNTGLAMGTQTNICNGSLNPRGSGSQGIPPLPAWCAGVSNVNGAVSFTVPGSIIRFECYVRWSVTSGTPLSVQFQSFTTGGNAGGNIFNSEDFFPMDMPTTTLQGWCLESFLYQVNSTATDTVRFTFVLNPSAAGNATMFSWLKGYRVF